MPKKILIVERDEKLAGVLRRVLEKKKGELNAGNVICVSNMADAKPHLATADAVVTGYCFHDGMGTDLIKEWHSCKPGAKAVILTGELSEKAQVQTVFGGADAEKVIILPASFDLHELMTAVSQALNGSTTYEVNSAEIVRDVKAAKVGIA